MKFKFKLDLEYEVEAKDKDEACIKLEQQFQEQNTTAESQFWDNIKIN